MDIEKYLEQTRLYKEGGSCFECCEYEEMVVDLRATLTEVAAEAMREALAEVRNAISCSECNGSGEYSTPSDYSPCSNCEGSGYNLDGRCNDFLDFLTK